MFKHQTVAARTLLLLASLMLGPAQANTTSPGEMQAGSLLMRMSEG